MKLDVYDSGMKGQVHKIPLVFIHGAWCGKWVWQPNFIPFFEERGYRCVAVDLRGHGKSEGREKLNKSTMSDYAEDVLSLIEGLGNKAVVIGHSMGGGVTEKMIAKSPAAAAVLMAPVPPQGGLITYNKFKKMFPGKMVKVMLTRNMFFLVKDPRTTKPIFFTDSYPDSEMKVCHDQLCNESAAFGMELKRPTITGDPNPFKVPVLLLGANRDWFFSPEEINRAGEIYGVKPVFFDDGHFLMLEDCWKDVASTIDQWLVSQGL